MGEYFGFELDGNGRFLLSDGTVTHNTSSILALARSMYGDKYRNYILELNASDHRGIDVVRQEIPKFAGIKSNDLRFVILDEADAMTPDAQSALRRIMEIYSRGCRFCLICNNINKIIPGIQSRCAKMRFGVLDKDSIKGKLDFIMDREGVKATPEAINHLLMIHQDFRQILNTLQCLKSISSSDTITETEVIEYLGKPNSDEIKSIVAMFHEETFQKCYTRLQKLHRENKINLVDLIKSLVDCVIEMEMDENRRSHLLNGMAQVQYRVVTGGDNEIQLASLVAIWKGGHLSPSDPLDPPGGSGIRGSHCGLA